jgi:hypothetical protein
MKLNKTIFTIISLTIMSTGFFAALSISNIKTHVTKESQIAILINDSYSLNDDAVKVWTQAAKEEGIDLSVISSSDLLRTDLTNNKSYDKFAGIIVPDSIHKKGGDALINKLKEYTNHGGKTMIVFDAITYENTGSFSPGFFFKGKAPLSDLVGIEYALYDKLSDKSISLQQIYGTPSVFESLQLPPGKYEAEKDKYVIKTYGYEKAVYPTFVTGKILSNSFKPLLTAGNGSIVASLNHYGKGNTFFLNIPATYLKARTDGAFLNGALYYFAHDLVKVPMLSRTPNNKGIGILNIHIDSNAAIRPLETLTKEKFFDNGPFSIHITAGPDCYDLNDKLGFNLDKNSTMQYLVKDWMNKKHAIGNHGGWAHNYFAAQASLKKSEKYKHLLDSNEKSVSSIIGKSTTEYSSPEGVTPIWVVDWLKEHKVKAYYFTGNIGMAPTKTFRDGKLVDDDNHIWSFPVATSGRAATFEEAFMYNKTEYEMGEWISNLIRFNIQQKTARLVYFHPPGAMPFMDAIYRMIDEANANKKAGLFEWRTMSNYADFLNKRELTKWNMVQKNDKLFINLSNPQNLDEIVFKIPKMKYKIVANSTFTSQEDGNYYYIKSKLSNIEIEVIKQ